LSVRRVEHDSFTGRAGPITRAEPVDVGDEEAGVDHAQGREHTLAQELVGRLAGSPGDEHAEHIGPVL
jgi:hypothetical protein